MNIRRMLPGVLAPVLATAFMVPLAEASTAVGATTQMAASAEGDITVLTYNVRGAKTDGKSSQGAEVESTQAASDRPDKCAQPRHIWCPGSK